MQWVKGGGRRYVNLSFAAATALLCAAVRAANPVLPAHFLVANDDSTASFPPSTVSFFAIGAGGFLAAPTTVSTGGNGMAGGYFGIARILTATAGPDICVFASNAQSETISGIDARTRRLAGAFRGSRADHKLARDGIGLTIGGDRLYATFSGSGNIGVFQIQPGCKLQFIGDVRAHGLHGGMAE